MAYAKLIQAIETTIKRKDNPCRLIIQYWSTEGKLLAESDPCAEEFRTQVQSLIESQNEVERLRGRIKEAEKATYNKEELKIQIAKLQNNEVRIVEKFKGELKIVKNNLRIAKGRITMMERTKNKK